MFGRLGAQRDPDRPASNRLDRFGRVAYNKNRELSQASLDCEKNSVSLSPPNSQRLEEEKKQLQDS